LTPGSASGRLAHGQFKGSTIQVQGEFFRGKNQQIHQGRQSGIKNG
jgi:hypothetical protein